MNQRQQVPPAFYGIHNDNDNNIHQTLTTDDLEAFHAATVFLIEAAYEKCQERTAVLDKKTNEIVVACRRKTAEIDAIAEQEFRTAELDYWSDRSTIEDALRSRHAINKKADDATNLVNQELEVAERLMEERERLWTTTRSEILRITEGLRVVLLAHGLDAQLNADA